MTQVAVGAQIWHYEEIGGGKKTPLLILHGWGRSGGEWLTMARELSAWSGRKVYVLDLPGFGGSSLGKFASLTSYTEQVVLWCKYLGIKRAIVLGHSLGGRMGIILGAKYSDMVEKLILVDPAGVKPHSLRRVVLAFIAKLVFWIPLDLRRRIGSRWMDGDYLDNPSLQELYRSVVREDLRKYLSRINCFVDLIWGEKDPLLPLSLTRIYLRKLKQARVRVVWGAGHDPHLTHFDQTLAILQESTE